MRGVQPTARFTFSRGLSACSRRVKRCTTHFLLFTARHLSLLDQGVRGRLSELYTRCTPHFLVYSTHKFLNRIKGLGAEKVSCALALLYSRDKCAKTKRIVVVHPLLSYGEGAHFERAPLLEARKPTQPGQKVVEEYLGREAVDEILKPFELSGRSDNPLGLPDLSPETEAWLRKPRSVQGSRDDQS